MSRARGFAKVGGAVVLGGVLGYLVHMALYFTAGPDAAATLGPMLGLLIGVVLGVVGFEWAAEDFDV